MKIATAVRAFAGYGVAAAALAGLAGSQGIPPADPKQAAAPPGLQHGHEGLTWPPQPRGITNAVVHSNVEQEKKDIDLQRARMDRLVRKARTAPEVNRALGNAFTPIAVIDKDDKTSGRTVTQMVFFSRENNTTVDVEFDKGEAVRAVRSTPAWEYQPEITDEEAAEAAGLARAYFLGQGIAKAAGLRAYGILAYRPEGKGFFDTRVLYVSFHKHGDALPELAAWVDLTNQLILKTRQEQ